MIGKLFSANPARIGRFNGPPTCDAVPASMVDGTPGDLKADLIALLGKENVLHIAIDLVRYASDGTGADDVQELLAKHGFIPGVVVFHP